MWGKAKCYTRANTNFTLVGLRRIIPIALDSVAYVNILGRPGIMRWLTEKVIILVCNEVEQALKVYKSHRRIFFEHD